MGQSLILATASRDLSICQHTCSLLQVDHQMQMDHQMQVEAHLQQLQTPTSRNGVLIPTRTYKDGEKIQVPPIRAKVGQPPQAPE